MRAPSPPSIARRKMEEAGQDPEQVNVVEPYPRTVEAGPFRSVRAGQPFDPRGSALVIDTPEGRVVHSGDFKIDHDPVVGEAFDEEMFRDIANGGVKALICDSTNVFSRIRAGRKPAGLPDRQADRRGKGHGGGHDLRLQRRAAEDAGRGGGGQGRSICLLGRAMKRMVTAAVETGVLTDFPRTRGCAFSPEEATRGAAREPDADRHRQPGGTPRGLRRAQPGQAIWAMS
jgi:ribonuclease J